MIINTCSIVQAPLSPLVFQHWHARVVASLGWEELIWGWWLRVQGLSPLSPDMAGA